VTAEAGPAEVAVSVLDDGLGMPPELAAAPFEPARRPRASARTSAGAGLGLSIAKGIVQAHGGRLELAPLAKGTCFSVLLPVEGEALEAVRAAPARPQHHEDRPQHNGDRLQHMGDRPQHTEERPQYTEDRPQHTEDRPRHNGDRPPVPGGER
jgi:hypothetical protein